MSDHEYLRHEGETGKPHHYADGTWGADHWPAEALTAEMARLAAMYGVSLTPSWRERQRIDQRLPEPPPVKITAASFEEMRPWGYRPTR